MKDNIFSSAFSSALASRLHFVGKYLTLAARRYPRSIVTGMILLMVLSAALSFTLMRAGEPSTSFSAKIAQYPGTPPKISPSALLEVLALQSELKSFADKDEPGPLDSLRMEQILKRIQQLNQN